MISSPSQHVSPFSIANVCVRVCVCVCVAGQELVLKIKTIQCTKITENEAQEEFLEDIKAESVRVGRHAPLRPVSTEPRFREALLLGDGQSAPGTAFSPRENAMEPQPLEWARAYFAPAGR